MRFATLAALALSLAPAPAFAQAAGEASAVVAPKCDHACLIRAVEAHMKALAARDPRQLRLAKDVRYAENDVLLPVGQAQWGGADPRELTDFAVQAEDLGFSSLWVNDFLLTPRIEALTMLAAVAPATSGITNHRR